MPHLRSLAEQYEDVVFLAVSDEEKEVVEGFLEQASPEGKTWAEAMAYTVATDPDGSVKGDIHAASGQRGIPSSFIIREGVIQWIGHPLALDEPLAAVVAGRWDPAAEQALSASMSQLRAALNAAEESGDWGRVVGLLDELHTKHPTRLDLGTLRWKVLLTRTDRAEDVAALGAQLVEAAWDSADTLNDLAWTMVDDEDVRNRDLSFAMRAAARANELTESRNAAILDTVARVYYEQGELEEAVRRQRSAVEHADHRMRDQLQEVLDQYERELAEKTPSAEEPAWF